MDFDDARGLDSGSENVLLCGLVVSGAEPVQVIQETVNKQTQDIRNQVTQSTL